MDGTQFSAYLDCLDHPKQLELTPNVASLYLLYSEHITSLAYSNLDLFMGKPVPDLSIDAILDHIPTNGGHCYQHSELMYAALNHLGFDVTRVACWVLMGKDFKHDMPLNHNILLVKIDGDTYLCDPGLASTSPRFPLKLNMAMTEDVTISEGNTYRLEVNQGHYNFFWLLKNEWFLLFRFERSTSTGWAVPSNKETTLQLCKEVYEVPYFIPIRDKYVKVAKQTNDSKIDFFYSEGRYVYKVFHKGSVIETKTDLDYEQFFKMINKMCNLSLTPITLPNK